MKKAVVFLGGLVVLKNPKFIEVALQKDLEILVLDQETERLLNCVNVFSKEKYHPFNNVREFSLYKKYTEIFSKFESWSSEYEIVSFICFNENMVSVSGMVSKLFNLPGPGIFASTVCNDKFLQRKLLENWSPRYTCVKCNERPSILDKVKGFTFPVVCKPTGRSSSSGVVLIKDEAHLINVLEDYSVNETLLIEEYIDGKEFSVEALIRSGEVVFSGITEKKTNEVNGDFFVEMGHLVPAKNISNIQKNKMIEINTQISKVLNFENGISHAEYKIDENGEIKLMEIAARPPGDALIDLYSISLGYSFENLLLDIYSKGSIHIPILNHQKYAKQIYIDHPYGILKEVKAKNIPVTWMYDFSNNGYLDFLKMRENNSIHSIIMYRLKEEILSEIKSSYDRSGAFIISNNKYENLKLLEENVLGDIEIIVK